MIGWIRKQISLHIDYSLPAFFRFYKRKMEYGSRINDLAKKIYAPKSAPSISLSVVNDIMHPPCASASGHIWIPSVFMIQSEDLPSEFRIKSLDDSRLKSDDFIQRVADWSHEFFGYEKPKPLNFMEKTLYKMFLQYLSNPEQSEDAKDMILGHEIGHIFHQHTHGHDAGSEFLSKKTLIATCTTVLLLLLAFLVIPMPFSWIAIGIAILVAAVVYIPLLQKIYCSRRCEQEADFVGASIGERTRLGGIYLFNIFQEGFKRARWKNLVTWLMFNSNGDARLLSLTHPSYTTRIKALKKYKRVLPGQIPIQA